VGEGGPSTTEGEKKKEGKAPVDKTTGLPIRKKCPPTGSGSPKRWREERECQSGMAEGQSQPGCCTVRQGGKRNILTWERECGGASSEKNGERSRVREEVKG